MKSSAAFDKNTVEFVTVAAEYCAFLEQIFDKEPKRVVDVLCKLLPLVYLKATMLPEAEPEGLYLEESVTEADYEEIRTRMAQKLGEYDDYLEVFEEDMKYSDTPVRKCISEDLADIYQALRNFVQSYRSGLDEVMTEAVAVCSEGFRTYWGQTLANTLRAVHNVRYSSDMDIDNSLYD
ncbi:MAG: DUF5063 domain-containing protein [Bacteroidaceae bacterium]|nr:DUF5063 domain-containing protein [Bacteroidaceae bacterium]